MAMPKNALHIRKLVSVGAKAEASSKMEKATMFSMSVGRLPNRSASRPKIRAPKGRMTKVQKIASAICLMAT
jgi:hypothetical protein